VSRVLAPEQNSVDEKLRNGYEKYLKRGLKFRKMNYEMKMPIFKFM
jgi:hypothetical protein